MVYFIIIQFSLPNTFRRTFVHYSINRIIQKSWTNLLTKNTGGLAVAPGTSSAEAILHRGFRPLARYTHRMGLHSGNQSLCVRGGFLATVARLEPDPAR